MTCYVTLCTYRKLSRYKKIDSKYTSFPCLYRHKKISFNPKLHYNTSAEICNTSTNYKIQKFWFAVFEAWFKYIFHCLQQKTILEFVKRLILSKICSYGLEEHQSLQKNTCILLISNHTTFLVQFGINCTREFFKTLKLQEACYCGSTLTVVTSFANQIANWKQ